MSGSYTFGGRGCQWPLKFAHFWPSKIAHITGAPVAVGWIAFESFAWCLNR